MILLELGHGVWSCEFVSGYSVITDKYLPYRPTVRKVPTTNLGIQPIPIIPSVQRAFMTSLGCFYSSTLFFPHPLAVPIPWRDAFRDLNGSPYSLHTLFGIVSPPNSILAPWTLEYTIQYNTCKTFNMKI